MKQLVTCVDDRNLDDVKEGEEYIIDLDTVYGDSDGDWYGSLFTKGGDKIALGVSLRRFRSITNIKED